MVRHLLRISESRLPDTVHKMDAQILLSNKGQDYKGEYNRQVYLLMHTVLFGLF